MEFILFLIFLILHLAIFASLSYLSRLLFFEKKDEYYREEIVSLGRAIPIEILRIFESGGNAILGLAFFLLSALFMFLWAMLGGIIGSPHYTHSFGNYFFHFPLFFFAFIFSYSFLKSAAQTDNPQDPLTILLSYGQVIAIGLSVGSLAKILTSYGSHHEMYFFFYFVVFSLICFISAYLWNGRQFFGIAMPGSSESNWEDNESWEGGENLRTNSQNESWDDDTDQEFSNISPQNQTSASTPQFQNQTSTPKNSIPTMDDLDYSGGGGDDLDLENVADNENSLDSSDFDLEWDDFAEKQD